MDCGTPVRPDNGRIVGTEFTFQHTVEVQCGPGFYLDGPDQLTCNENAAWVGGESSPMCIGKTAGTFFSLDVHFSINLFRRVSFCVLKLNLGCIRDLFCAVFATPDRNF